MEIPVPRLGEGAARPVRAAAGSPSRPPPEAAAEAVPGAALGMGGYSAASARACSISSAPPSTSEPNSS